MRWILPAMTILLIVGGIALVALGETSAGGMSACFGIAFGLVWGIVEMDRAT